MNDKNTIRHRKIVFGAEEYLVTDEEMSRFSKNEEKLREKLIARREEEKRKKSSVSTYEAMAEQCGMSVDSLKKTLRGEQDLTRTFLYRYTVGLRMTLEEANAHFALLGGPLREDDPGDYICICAIRDKDNIDQFNELLKEHLTSKINQKRKKNQLAK